MVSYKSNRKNGFSYWLKQLLFGLFAFAIVLAASYVFPELLPSKNTTWILLFIILSINHLISLSSYNWINEVFVDPENRILSVEYYNIRKGKKICKFQFDELKIRTNRGRLFNKSKILSISIFEGREEQFEISRAKDGYSQETLNTLAAHFELLTHPV